MAKRVILEAYAFDTSNKKITIKNRVLRKEQVVLITNVTTNTILYNFAESAYAITNANWLLYTTDPVTGALNAESTVITLNASVSMVGMNNTDALSILVEETNESMQPAEAMMDPVGKYRVSTPQSLIDTDFEYGTQPTKWESIAMAGNRPGFFYDSTLPIPIVSINTTANTRIATIVLANGNSTTATCTANSNIVTGLTAPTNGVYSVGMTVTAVSGGGILVGATVTAVLSTTSVTLSCYAATGVAGSLTIALGTNLTTLNSLSYTNGYNPVYIQDSLSSIVNGWQMPATVTQVNTTNTQSFTIYAKEQFPASVQYFYDPLKTYMFLGSAYTGSGIALGLSAFTYSSNTITCTTLNAHGFSVGQSICVTNTYAASNPPNGTWIVKSVPTSNSFVFDIVVVPTGTIQCGTTINGTSVASTPSGATVAVLSANINGQMMTVGVTAAGSNYQIGDILLVGTGANGYVKVLAINITGGVTAFGIYAQGTSGYAAGQTGLTTTYTYTCNSLFIRPWSGAIHRAFDGGVQFGAGLPYHGNQVIRQTRRYFRYQSGKGIQFATGSNFCSVLVVDTMTASGTTVTVTTKYSHNLGVGCAIKVTGSALTSGLPDTYDGTGVLGGSTYVVTEVVNDLQFKYIASGTPTNSTAVSTASSILAVQPVKWYGGSVRVGMFDTQNGYFFQYDGQIVSVVRRSSTQQIAGYINSLGQGGQVCLGTGTSWATQLAPGNFIVIRGQSHIVVSIESNTSMTISPEYKGAAIVFPSQAIVSKTIDTKYIQSAWNIDTCDGKGASGFNLDPTKMQMWITDYAWYGAGAIRFGFKNQRGEIMYVHRIAHGNGQTEAYMRSGNLPARYEVNTWWPTTTLLPLGSTLASGATSITVADSSGFPLTNGVLCLQASGNTSAAIEYVKYTTLTTATNTFSGCTRGCTTSSNALIGPGLAAGGGSAATAFTPTTTAPVMVSLYMPTAASTISHWGSAVLMDGRYDDDKSFLFNYGTPTPISFATSLAGVRCPLFSIRLAPSVDSGFTNVLGYREIINRMQLALSSCGVYVTGSGVKVEVFLNARVTTPANTGVFTSLGGSSLAQFATHVTNAIPTPAGSMLGGECIYTFFAPAGSVSTQDLSKVRDAGTGIQGGGTHLNTPLFSSNIYPDGPDVITVAITALTSTAAVVAGRLNWTEAQA